MMETLKRWMRWCFKELIAAVEQVQDVSTIASRYQCHFLLLKSLRFSFEVQTPKCFLLL